MAKITRIKAQDPSKPQPKTKKVTPKPNTKSNTKPTAKPNTKSSTKTPKTTNTKVKQVTKSPLKPAKPLKKALTPLAFLGKPFVKLGRYLKNSWREIRQVRWPNRKTTWKMTFAVLLYTAFFILLILVLDIFFSFVFNNILKH